MANKLASDSLKGRVFECALADLQNDEIAYRKFKLVAEDVQGKNVLTNFHGMNLTTGKLRTEFLMLVCSDRLQDVVITRCKQRS